MMHNDEEATHAQLTALLADAVIPAITEHGGRIVKNTGDGFLVTLSWEMEHLFEDYRDCLFGIMGCDRIVTDVHAANDARVRIGEWLLGVRVYEKSAGLLLDFAIAHTLESWLQGHRLCTERVVECVRCIWVLGQLNIGAGGSQLLNVCLARSNWVVVILRAAEDADGSTNNIRIEQESCHAIRVERDVGHKIRA